MQKKVQDYSHKRFNILTGEWILVSPHRNKRPWLGQQEKPKPERPSNYDPQCYLCPNNIRAGGKHNPNYNQTYVFQNDFAALEADSEVFALEKGLLKAKSERGICKVVCFSPNHSKTLADFSINELNKVIQTWQAEFSSLAALKNINYIQIFENKGAIMGCSNPHPHGQIWAQESLPNEVVKRNKQQLDYSLKNKRSLLGDYIHQELIAKERIIHVDKYFVVLVPFWAIWPYEVMIIPKQQQQNILELSKEEQHSFAQCIQKTTRAYDKIFDCSFPYSSGIHQAPCDGKDQLHWHWHMSFYPPLLRSATVKKFMVGYELFGMPQRDITAEMAAETIRNYYS